jgi:DNA-binding beta-propeller fold protein YncE
VQGNGIFSHAVGDFTDFECRFPTLQRSLMNTDWHFVLDESTFCKGVQQTGGGKAAIMDDFVLLGEEVNSVIQALRSNGICVSAVAFAAVIFPSVQTTQPLRLDKTIELHDVQGRIDHMSVDVKGQRLFVSALGNNTVEVIDIKEGKRLKTISGMAEPQGVLYVPTSDRIYVANAKDGSVRIFDGTSYVLLKTMDCGDDADNLRFDASRQRVIVGCGDGSLGEIDLAGNKIAETKVSAHPESFQLETGSPRIYVNLPKSRKIAVVDRDKHVVTATWGTGMSFANFPMALDEKDHRLFVVTRFPARLLVFDTERGKIVQSLSAAGDSDDVFYDQARKRIYTSGGDGAISVFEQQDPDHYKESARIATVKGARTSFFSTELDRLFLAVRRQGSQPAAIQVFAPVQ